MNIGVVSINLPMYALEAKGELEEFYKLLDNNLEMAYKMHMVRVERIKHTKARQNPTLFIHGAIARLQPEQTIEHLLYGGRSSISIGFVGLAETVEVLVGGEDKKLAMSILSTIKAKLELFTGRCDISFSLYGSPSESLAYKFAKALKEKFPEFQQKDYITNSFHQPVWIESSPFKKWEYEEGFAKISSGGHIGYIEQPSLKNNLEAYEAFVNFAYTKIPYFGINVPVDKCYLCGCEEEAKATAEGFECKGCGNKDKDTLKAVRRISGYLTSPTARPANKGKHQEMCERVKHY